jgi:hypothetical protein
MLLLKNRGAHLGFDSRQVKRSHSTVLEVDTRNSMLNLAKCQACIGRSFHFGHDVSMDRT